jgi:hypothetical protein
LGLVAAVGAGVFLGLGLVGAGGVTACVEDGGVVAVDAGLAVRVAVGALAAVTAAGSVAGSVAVGCGVAVDVGLAVRVAVGVLAGMAAAGGIAVAVSVAVAVGVAVGADAAGVFVAVGA